MEDIMVRLQRAFDVSFEDGASSVTIDTTPDDIPDWDSLGHVTLASNIEQEFHVSFDVDELMEMENVRQIVRILKAKLSGN